MCRTVIEAADTVEGTQTTPQQNVSVGPIDTTDPDGTPGTGDETAAPAAATASFPDQTWTAGASGTIEFREDTVTPLGVDTGGIVINADVGLPFDVQFRCSPGTVAGPDPGVVAFTDPAASFASTVFASTVAGEFSFGKLKARQEARHPRS